MAREELPHRCDETCTCPDHGSPTHYWPAGNEHACQDPACRYAHGYESQVVREMPEWPRGFGRG